MPVSDQPAPKKTKSKNDVADQAVSGVEPAKLVKGKNVNEGWTDEELRAAVLAYAEMQRKEKNGEPFVKAKIYRDLSSHFARTPKAFERRMQNISSVMHRMGRAWVTGLLPLNHSGSAIEAVIERLIGELDNDQKRQSTIFAEQVRAAYLLPALPRPTGQKRPTKRLVNSITKIDRDPKVIAWVLQQAKGVCECCGKIAPFISVDNLPYLEVHHVHLLADGGSDTPENAVAICPNCHRELHLGLNKDELRARLYESIPRLEPE